MYLKRKFLWESEIAFGSRYILNPLILFFLLAEVSLSATASVVNKGVRIVVMPDTALHLEGSASAGGDFVNLSDGSSNGVIVLKGTMSVPGNWSNNAASGTVFDDTSSGTVELTGTGQTISGSTKFPNLEKTAEITDTLTFSAGTANQTVVNGILTLQGASGQLLSLRSSSPGSQWKLDAAGTRNLLFLDIKDSDNVSTTFIDVSGAQCLNTGNNERWIFSIGVTFTANPNGSLSGETVQNVALGASTSPVEAIPDQGYFFTGWTEDYSGNMNPLVISNVTFDMAVIANFASISSSHTLFFSAGENGSLSGETEQEVEDGSSSSPVSAIPDSGYYFTGWTGDYTGNLNPLSFTEVSSDMAITANFATIPDNHFVVNFLAGANGVISGNISQIVVSGNSCQPVFAASSGNWHFSHWSGDIPPGKETDNPLRVEDVTSNMTITANFAANEYGKVTLAFLPGPNGALEGECSQIVEIGASSSAVLAVPEDGYAFLDWTGTGEKIYDNPLVFENVRNNMLITADFGIPSNELAFGKIFSISPSDIEGFTGNQFTSRPSILAVYNDPVSGRNGLRVRMRVMNRINARNPQPQTDCEIARMIKLMNMRLWDRSQTCAENLVRLFPPDGKIPELILNPVLVTVRDESGKLLSKIDVGAVSLQPPIISGVIDSYGTEISEAAPGQEITVEGFFFGRPAVVNNFFVGNMCPLVYLEYPRNGKVRRLKLQILRPYSYPDYRGRENKSCMDVHSGISKVSFMIPTAWPPGWNNQDQHNIVIDNKIGVATIPFRISE